MEDFRQMNPVFLRSDETAVVIDDSIPLIMLFVEERSMMTGIIMMKLICTNMLEMIR